MNKRYLLSIILCFQLLITTGCWDRKELNDRALWLASGLDAGEKKGIILSGQVVIPSNMQTQSGGGGGGGSGKEYITVSSEGINVQDALAKMQNHLSREAFVGQRRVILLGEDFVKRGVKDEFDSSSRNAEFGIRTGMYIVKGDTAVHALNQISPLEKPSSLAILKTHEQAGGRVDTTLLEFLIAANSDGIRPTLPAVKFGYIQEDKSSAKGDAAKPIIELAGVGIFDKDLKLIGYLNMEENLNFLWLMGKIQKRNITSTLEEGNVSIQLTKMKSKITPKISKNNKISFDVELSGEGELTENNTNLNATNNKNRKFLETVLNKQVKEQVLQTIHKVQEEYRVDIFGFGEVLHKKHPQKWKRLKNNWDPYFTEADITVKVKLSINRTGMTGPSLTFKESEIDK